MFVALHHDGCCFALQKLQLCILMVASLHGFLQWSVWKPNLQHFSFSYWMSYILPPRILHSLRKTTTLLTRIYFILYENTLHSRKECSWFSYRAQNSLGWKQSFSWPENFIFSAGKYCNQRQKQNQGNIHGDLVYIQPPHYKSRSKSS